MQPHLTHSRTRCFLHSSILPFLWASWSVASLPAAILLFCNEVLSHEPQAQGKNKRACVEAAEILSHRTQRKEANKAPCRARIHSAGTP